MKDAKPDIQDIFCQALDRNSAEELRDFLDRACEGDADFRREVERLLQSKTTRLPVSTGVS